MLLLLYSTLEGVFVLEFPRHIFFIGVVSKVIIYSPIKLCKVLKFVS